MYSPLFVVPTPSLHQVDLIILPLTSIPLVGFWKLIPTFGGCIATKAKCSLRGDNNEVVEVRGGASAAGSFAKAWVFVA